MHAVSSGEIDPESIRDVAGCFVTWRDEEDRTLRGCLGVMSARLAQESRQSPGSRGHELISVVRRYAIASASEDPRFAAIPAPDFAGLRVGLTLLGNETLWPTPRVPGDLVIGEEGLHVRGDGLTGVLLPQVAVEWGYDGEAFLAATCVKAGLPREAWRRDGVEVSRFFGRELSASVRELLEGP